MQYGLFVSYDLWGIVLQFDDFVYVYFFWCLGFFMGVDVFFKWSYVDVVIGVDEQFVFCVVGNEGVDDVFDYVGYFFSFE